MSPAGSISYFRMSVNISRRNSLFQRVLRISYLLLALIGFSIRISSSDLPVTHIGDTLILNTLARGSMHGYGIVQRIHEAAEDLLKVEDGSLYPALYRMEERGWIKSEWGLSENNRRAKFYKLTKTGQRQLEAQRANWNRISKAVSRILQTT